MEVILLVVKIVFIFGKNVHLLLLEVAVLVVVVVIFVVYGILVFYAVIVVLFNC